MRFAGCLVFDSVMNVIIGMPLCFETIPKWQQARIDPTHGFGLTRFRLKHNVVVLEFCDSISGLRNLMSFVDI